MKNKFCGKMKNLSRVLLLVSALLLSSTFFFPLWTISLSAPQYPEGLSFSIWSSKLSGDIQTVNILNHYIGMAPIQEDSFQELQIFPKAFIALMVLSLLAAVIGRKIISHAWTLSILSFAAWALYDFWQWEYKFGHELNPDAAIKMEDMVYQPPLIGTKDFLNIEANSWPALAGIAFSIAVIISIAVFFIEFRKEKAT